MITNVFAPFYYKTRIETSEDIKRELMPWMEEQYQKKPDNQPSDWICKVHTSFDNEQPELNQYRKHYQTHVQQFMREMKFDSCVVKMSSLWFNYYGKGQWQESHSHNGGFGYLSCVHFLKYDAGVHPPLLFNNPSRVVIQPFILAEGAAGYWSQQIRAEVQEGDLIIFPCTLEHAVPVQESDEPRITISFNLDLQPEKKTKSGPQA